MILDRAVPRMAKLLKKLRKERGISRRQLAYHAGVNSSVVCRAERGKDAQLSTWERLFEGLGYHIRWDTIEIAEEIPDVLLEEKHRRTDRRIAGLCTGKDRCY